MLTISNTISNVNAGLAVVPFITAGYPNIAATKEIIYLLDRKGANLIELGIPYSDALADGVIIQESSRIALDQNVYMDQVLELLRQVSSNIKAPIIIFTYFNPILSRGLKNCLKEISESGAKGLVIPDLPLEESDYVIALCSYYGIELILFIAPTSSEARIRSIIAKAPGSLYLVSSYGVTGLRVSISSNLKDLVKIIKRSTNKCVMLGFGISNAEHVAKIIDLNLGIDAIVMGSAFIKKITDGYEIGNYENLGLFCESIENIVRNIHQ
uniref:Tryptophan synthase alpha chain n=1 Tax=Calliarthron tuberculosum TaxID=48942 RepID=M4ITX7_CALTB|nr:tryptophan synthase alpha chain [Calliarthron tuberculosum]AGA63931.1 tryptophan synthase alpha chain [Calliarthron tuberculosum]